LICQFLALASQNFKQSIIADQVICLDRLVNKWGNNIQFLIQIPQNRMVASENGPAVVRQFQTAKLLLYHIRVLYWGKFIRFAHGAYQDNGRKKHRDSLRGVGATLRAGGQ